MKSFVFRGLIVVLVVIIAAGVCVPAVFAAPAHPQDVNPGDLTSVLRWLIAGGAAVVVSALLSFLGERWSWFQSLEPFYKRLSQVGLSILLSIAAKAILDNVPSDVIQAIQPYWELIAVALAGVGGNQLFHVIQRGNPQTVPAVHSEPSAIQMESERG
jgi:hypothetical protein